MFGQLLARVDILEKVGNQFRLIEVKAKGFNSQEADGFGPFRGKRGDISSKWQPYLEDVAFQTHIVRSLYPKAQVTPFLCLVDKSKTCNAETSFDKFQVVPRKKQEAKKVFSRPEVVFTGSVEALRKNPFVTVVDVSDEVEELIPIVRESAVTFSASLNGEAPVRIPPALGVKCKKCEYRIDDGAKSGFQECWGKLAGVSPHLLDFYRVDVHNEWINIEESYPNFEFARSLKRIINGSGTVFVWSHFEKTALKDVRRQLVQYGHTDHDLATWLDRITSDHGLLVDLYELAKEHYFHPRMAGSLSIKYVLPAVWFESEKIRNHPWFSQYVREKDGQLLEPYEALDPLPFGDDAIEDEGEAVREGTGAIRTYQEMMYGLHKSDSAYRNNYKQLLLNYCKLDTAAMVMIWMHWFESADAGVQEREVLPEQRLFGDDFSIRVSLVRRNHHHRIYAPSSARPRQPLWGRSRPHGLSKPGPRSRARPC